MSALPWIQVDRNFLTLRAPELAAALGLPVPHVVGHVVMLWSWCQGRDSGDLAGRHWAGTLEVAAGWAGESGAFAQALVDCDLVEPREGGCRIRGLDRYEKAKTKAEADRLRLANKRAMGRETQANARQSRDRPTDVAATSPRRPSDVGATVIPTSGGSDVRRKSSVPSEQAAPVQTGIPGIGRRTDKPPGDPRHAPLTRALAEEFERQRGTPYAHRGGRDARDIATLLTLGEPEEVLRRWRIGLAATFATCATPGDLVREWNRHSTADPRSRGPDTPFAPRVHTGDRPRL